MDPPLAFTKRLSYGRLTTVARATAQSREATVRFLVSLNAVRIGLALAGFVVALISVVLDDRQIAWGAIALLIGSLICRILIRKRQNSEPPSVHDCDGNHR